MKKKNIFLIIFLLILILFVFLYFYLSDYYKTQINVNDYINNNEEIIINKINEGYFIDSKKSDNAIIFYPGGKVEMESYIPLTYNLALNGFDCFLLKMPFNLAILDINAADNIINNYKYDNWYLMGHSLGGVVASMYVNNNYDKVNGLILLASYPTSKVSEDVKLLSIVGSEDGIININKYDDSKKYWNANSKEVILDGANHSQYGNYGEQKGDNKSKITRELQQEETINEITRFITNVE